MLTLLDRRSAAVARRVFFRILYNNVFLASAVEPLEPVLVPVLVLVRIS